jgi:hypothetical protein
MRSKLSTLSTAPRIALMLLEARLEVIRLFELAVLCEVYAQHDIVI